MSSAGCPAAAASCTAATAGCSLAAQTHERVASMIEARMEKKGCLGRYTLSEVAQHNHKDSAWLVVSGRVSAADWRCCMCRATERALSF